MPFFSAKRNTRPNSYHYFGDEDERDNGYGANASHNLNQVEFSTTATATLGFTTRGPADTGFWIDWGDGSNREWVAHVGTSTDVVTNHNYGGLVGTKPILLEGVLTDITKFSSPSPSFSGKINAFSAMKSLTNLQVQNSVISGDIQSLSTLTSLTLLYFYNTPVSGNINNLATLLSLTDLIGHTTSISGDIGTLSPITGFSTLVLRNNSLTYGTTTLPAWDGIIRIQDNGLTQTEVDNFLIDLDAAGGSNGTLEIHGTNAAPSAASSAARTALLGRGWTLTTS